MKGEKPLSKAFLFGLFLASVAAFFLGAFATGPSQAEVDQQVQREIGDALVSNCQSNLAFRRQNLKRSRAATKSYKYEIQANEQLIEVINLSIAQSAAETGVTPEPLVKLGHALDRQNAKLGDLRASFKIIPLPECEELRQLVEDGESN
jgi:flagellar motor protein MotB